MLGAGLSAVFKKGLFCKGAPNIFAGLLSGNGARSLGSEGLLTAEFAMLFAKFEAKAN